MDLDAGAGASGASLELSRIESFGEDAVVVYADGEEPPREIDPALEALTEECILRLREPASLDAICEQGLAAGLTREEIEFYVSNGMTHLITGAAPFDAPAQPKLEAVALCEEYAQTPHGIPSEDMVRVAIESALRPKAPEQAQVLALTLLLQSNLLSNTEARAEAMLAFTAAEAEEREAKRPASRSKIARMMDDESSDSGDFDAGRAVKRGRAE